MSRVIAILACGLSVAACSASMPGLDFFRSTPPSEQLRFESEPPGAEVKTSSAQTCRTPCELMVQVAPELSATMTLAGYQPQTVTVRSDASSGSARLAPNPVYAQLQPVAPPLKKRFKKKPAVAAAPKASPATSPVASAAPAAPQASAPAPAPASEKAASATNYPWPDPPSAK